MGQTENGEFKEILDKALKFLSFRPRSEQEMISYLSKKKATPEITKSVLFKLKELKLVDDEAFVKWWVEQRSLYRPRSIRVMRIELEQKGISKDLLNSLTSQFSSSDEEVLAEKVVQKKIARLKNLPLFEAKRKLYQLLGSRGYSYEVIKRVVDKTLKKE